MIEVYGIKQYAVMSGMSPIAIEAYGNYMHAHRYQSDGTLRASDNWTKGIPQREYLKSLLRHVMDVWLLFRGAPAREDKETALCAIIFNAQGLLHEILKDVPTKGNQ
jgi:hypothetical protein